jgi:thioredoxin-related protein
MKKIVLIAFAAFLCTAAIAQTETAPEKKTVEIYNPKANAQADINAAVAKAKKEKKHVFIQVGGNWCVWCIRFHDLVAQTPELKEYLNKNYETVLVNWSPENKNEAVMKKLGYPGRFGFPVFLILNDKGKLIHIQNSGYLEEGNGHGVKKTLEFLKNWNYGALLPENNKY